MKKVAFYTLGCKLNFSETSSIARLFENKGYTKVDFLEQPDIFVINTCSVTDNADKKCRKVVREALQVSPNAHVFIVGCYAQLKPREIAEIPGVSAVLGAAEKFQLPDLLEDLLKKPAGHGSVIASGIEKATAYHTAFSINDRTRTFLKVQDGCNYNCSFCTIPMARGKSRSDTIDNIARSARKIAESGVKEIVITGVNTGDFGIRNGRREERFIDLLKALDKVNGINRYRISSVEPNLLSNEIIKFVATSNKFLPHFHIPLQSGSDKILEAMYRRYRSDLYADRVQTIKQLMPHCCIGVDVIVGFPGETEEDFLTTYQFLNELDVSYLHVFTYSERDNTPAANRKDIVPLKVRNRRSKMLRNLSHKKKRLFYEDNLKSNQQVLFENDVENGMMNGFTRNYIRVTAKYDPLLINEILNVNLLNINEKGLVEVEESEKKVLTY
jgi:threonylcarbamoyladenosine tRNA methylthiotransferase MtaB